MRKIILVLALCICGIASAHAQTSGLNPPPPPVCSASNAGALYTETNTSPNTVWTCSYYNLQYQWVVNPMYGGLVYYPIVPTTCSGALPVFLAGYPNTSVYVCINGTPTVIGGGSGTSVYVNSTSISKPNFNDSTPPALDVYPNIKWQSSGSNVSSYLPYIMQYSQNYACPLGLGGLVGAFTNSSGVVEQNPLCIGNGPQAFTVTSASTAQLQLGINDYNWVDNTGSFTVDVSLNGAAPTSVTIPGKTLPWDPTVSGNSAYTFSSTSGTSPVVALTGLAAGDTVTITYVSGTVSFNSGTNETDANGYLTSPFGLAGPGGGPTVGYDFSGYGYAPTKYMSAQQGLGSGTVGNCTTAQAVAYYSSTGISVTCDGSFTTDGSGNVTMTSLTIPASGGVGGKINATEGTAPTAVSGHDILYADSTAHCLELSNNGGTFACLRSGGGGATLTLNSSGAGSSSPAAYDGSAPVTASYNTLGAAPAATGSPASYSAYGDSITNCVYLTTSTCWVNKLDNLLGGPTLTNNGLGGDQGCDVAYHFTSAQNPVITANPMYETLLIGTNDAIMEGSGAYETTFDSCDQAAIAWMGLVQSNKQAGSTATSSGTCSNDTTFPFVTGENCTGNGDTLTFSITTYGEPIYVWYRSIDSDAGTWTYTLDAGTPVAETTAFTKPMNTHNGHTTSMAFLRITASSGSHTLVFTKTNATGNMPVLAIGTLDPSTPIAAGLPVVIVGDINNNLNGVDQTSVTAYSTDVKSNIALLAGDGLNVHLAPVNATIQATTAANDILTSPSSTCFGTPSACPHPNIIGNIEMLRAFRAATRDFPQSATSSTAGVPYVYQWTYVPHQSSSLTTITSPAITIDTTDLLYVFCRTGGTQTSITVTDSLSNSFTATALYNAAGANWIESSYSFATVGGSDTFTCTSSAAATQADMIVLDIRNAPTTAGNFAGANSTSTSTSFIASYAASTSQRTLDVACTDIASNAGAFTSFDGGGFFYGTPSAVDYSDIYSTGPDAACVAEIIPGALSSLTVRTIYSTSSTNWVGSLVTFPY
ncbi:hypothetical protein KGP36_07525 [Patescibacteria group bacterium]|nr:hypothetical protein [Patescibacteria group bacterium]